MALTEKNSQLPDISCCGLPAVLADADPDVGYITMLDTVVVNFRRISSYGSRESRAIKFWSETKYGNQPTQLVKHLYFDTGYIYVTLFVFSCICSALQFRV